MRARYYYWRGKALALHLSCFRKAYILFYRGLCAASTLPAKDSFCHETAVFLLGRWPDARHVHRLDQDTSGLVVMALNVEAAREMCRQFRERGERWSARTFDVLMGEGDEAGTSTSPGLTNDRDKYEWNWS